MSSLSGVGEAEDGAELHPEDEVEDEEGLSAQCTGNVKLLKAERHRSANARMTTSFRLPPTAHPLPSGPAGSRSALLSEPQAWCRQPGSGWS